MPSVQLRGILPHAWDTCWGIWLSGCSLPSFCGSQDRSEGHLWCDCKVVDIAVIKALIKHAGLGLRVVTVQTPNLGMPGVALPSFPMSHPSSIFVCTLGFDSLSPAD